MSTATWFGDDDGDEDEDLKPTESEGGAAAGKYEHPEGVPDSDEAIDNSKQ